MQQEGAVSNAFVALTKSLLSYQVITTLQKKVMIVSIISCSLRVNLCNLFQCLGGIIVATSATQNELVGCVVFRRLAIEGRESEKICEMKRLYVRSSFRKAGVGRALVDRVFHEAKAFGYKIMRLDTLDVMKVHSANIVCSIMWLAFLFLLTRFLFRMHNECT